MMYHAIAKKNRIKTIRTLQEIFQLQSIIPLPSPVAKSRLMQYEPPKLGFKGTLLALYLELRPSIKWKLSRPIQTRKNVILCTDTREEFVQEILKNARAIFDKKKKAVILIGGFRGSGKSTSLDEIKKLLDPFMARINLDAYFKEPNDCRAIGKWDNPLNSHLSQAAQAIRDFNEGKKTYVPIGRVPRYGQIQREEIDPQKTPILVVEGIHALYPSISRLGDYRAFMYVPPGLQEIRTWMRDLPRPKAKEQESEYYLGMNMRVREMQISFILSRLYDADLLFHTKMSRQDLEAIGRMLRLSPQELHEYGKAWDLV